MWDVHFIKYSQKPLVGLKVTIQANSVLNSVNGRLCACVEWTEGAGWLFYVCMYDI